MRVECKFELTQAFRLGTNASFMNQISSAFLTPLKNIRQERPHPQLRLRTHAVASNKVVIEYLRHFPLFGAKHLDFLDWVRVVALFEKKQHYSLEGLELIRSIKKGMNDNRKNYT